MATRLESVHKFNVDEYFRMAELGIIPSSPIELVYGQIYVGGRPWRFTVEDYHRLIEEGILSEDDHVELIDGEIVDVTPAGSRHASCVSRLTRLVVPQVRDAIVRVQDPLALPGRTEIEPDLAVVRYREDFYAERHPLPDDVLLVVEVAESSARSDRTVKAELYALAGVAEYWLVDLTTRLVRVHLEPDGPVYRVVREFGRSDTVTPTLVLGLELSVEEIFG